MLWDAKMDANPYFIEFFFDFIFDRISAWIFARLFNAPNQKNRQFSEKL